MSHIDRGLERRLQLQQGLVWLASAQGDPYAALLRGLDADPREHWRPLAARPLVRSATGDWVTTRYEVARAVRAQAALREQPPLGADDEPGAAPPPDARPAPDTQPWPDAAAAGARHAPQAWTRALDPSGGQLDLVALARTAAVGTLAQSWGWDAVAEAELDEAVLLTRGALDAPFYPQSATDTRRIAAGLAALRSMVPAAVPEAVTTVVAGVWTTVHLVTEALVRYTATAQAPAARWERLLAEPEHAARVVRETVRLAPPLRLTTATAVSPCDLAGEHLEAGERVVTVLGAVNRAPEVFPDPDRFDPDRPAEQLAAVWEPASLQAAVLPFAAVCAAEGLRRLAAVGLRPAADGPLIRHTAAPVSRPLVSYPLATASAQGPSARTDEA